MIGELFKYFKANFSKRLSLYVAIIIAFSLLQTPLLLDVLVKIMSLVFLLTLSGIFAPIFVSQFVSHVKLLLAHKQRVKLPVSKEIDDLARQIGVEVKEIGIVKGCVAYVIGKTLVLGIELLRRLSFEQRQAVVAHELGHIKKRHRLLSVLFLLSITAIACFCFSKCYVPIFFIESPIFLMLTVVVNIAALVFVLTAFIPISWYFEMKADEVAAKFVGKKHIKSALLTIANQRNLEEPSETHPSIMERIKHVDKL